MTDASTLPEHVRELGVLFQGCGAILDRLDHLKSDTYCDTVEEVDQRHDLLLHEVENLAGMLRSLIATLTKDNQHG